MLSDSCKAQIYPNINYFKKNYFDRIFTENKMYNSTLWISSKNRNTYRIEIMGDILATGQKNNMPIEDYYTVIYENGEYKLNISSYIDMEQLNISNDGNNVTIAILNKKIYMDYEIYEIRVENKTNSNIILNKDNNSIYLEDENKLKHIAFANEISDYDLQIPSGLVKTYNIRFNRSYKPSINLEKILFNNIKIEKENRLINIEIDV